MPDEPDRREGPSSHVAFGIREQSVVGVVRVITVGEPELGSWPGACILQQYASCSLVLGS